MICNIILRDEKIKVNIMSFEIINNTTFKNTNN